MTFQPDFVELNQKLRAMIVGPAVAPASSTIPRASA